MFIKIINLYILISIILFRNIKTFPIADVNDEPDLILFDYGNSRVDERNLEFIILHNNDIHGRFDQTDKFSESCDDELAKNNQCYGGIARTAHVIRSFRNSTTGPPVLYLFAGDIFTGSVWFSLFKEEISSKFMNMIQPDASVLGNHEFDLGVKKLTKYLKNLNFPVVASNLDLSLAPELRSIPNIRRTLIIEVNNVKIGIIGYLTPDTMFQSNTGKVWIEPEIAAINKETQRLKREGIKIFIGLGHSGFEMDQEVAMHCPDIDLIIGGHTNTFLYSGEKPDIEEPVGEYPHIVTQASGKVVPVVQAYAYTKYLGYLEVKFNSDGHLLNCFGNPILLNSSIPQSNDVLEALNEYRPKIDALRTIIGESKVYLNGTKADCRKGECNLGDLIADALLYVSDKKSKSGLISLVGAGGIKNSINNGNITVQNIHEVLPYNSTLYVKKISGERIWAALEHSGTFYNEEEDGGFLQFSGIKVVYDMSKEKGKRLVSVEVRCTECSEETYQPIDMNQRYSVVMTSFLLKGGDQYNWNELSDMAEAPEELEYTDNLALADYIKEKSIIEQKEDGRLILLKV